MPLSPLSRCWLLFPVCTLIFMYALLSYLTLGLAALGYARLPWLLAAAVLAVGVAVLLARAIATSEPSDALGSKGSSGPRVGRWVAGGAAALTVAVGAHAWVLPPFKEDDLMYHLVVPRWIARTGHLVDDPYGFGAHLPHLFELPIVLIEILREILGGGVSPFLPNTLMLGVLAFLSVGTMVTRLQVPAALAALVTASLITMPVVFDLSHSAYVEIFFAVLLLLFFELYARHVGGDSSGVNSRSDASSPAPSLRPRLRLRFGPWYGCCVVAGLAAATKYYGLLLLPVLIVAERVRLQPKGSESARTEVPLWRGVALAMLIAAPWYLKNAIFTGNPIYPFAAFLFPSELLSIERIVMGNMFQSVYGAGRTLLDYLLLPLRLVAADWGGGSRGEHAGYLSALVILAIVAAKARASWARAAVLTALLFFLIWATSIHIVRYLFPFLVPAILIGTGVLCRGGRKGRIVVVVIAVIALGQSIRHVWNMGKADAIWERLAGQIDDDAFLRRKHPGSYGMAVLANQMVDAAKERIMLIGFFGRSYYFEAPTLSVAFYDTEPLVPAFNPKTPRPELFREFVAKEQVTHLLINWSFVEAFHARDSHFSVPALRQFLAASAETLVDQPPYALLRLRE